MKFHESDIANRAFHEFARLHHLTQWWHWMLVLVVCAAVVAYVVWMYVRDSVELQRGVAASLLLLRLLAFVGIFFTFLDLERLHERQLFKISRVILLVDTSQSMGIHDDYRSSESDRSRLDQVIDGLTNTSLVSDLRQLHDLVVYRFDQGSTPTQIASLGKVVPAEVTPPSVPDDFPQGDKMIRLVRRGTVVSGILLALGLLFSTIYVGGAKASGVRAWFLCTGVCLMCGSIVFAGAGHLRHPEVRWPQVVGASVPAKAPRPVVEVPNETSSDPIDSDDDVLWAEHLVPRGTETRLGESLRYLIEKERGGAIAGIVVFSDGNSNAGLEVDVVEKLASDTHIPVYSVGLGSHQPPVNVRVADLQAPPRVFPGDAFHITGFLQSHGLAGRTVTVGLYSVADQEDVNLETDAELVDQRRVRLVESKDVIPVKFEVVPADLGRRIYQLRVTAPLQDQNDRDNRKQSVVFVVERNNRVLLVAGGPTREYRFVRNLLFRDEHISVDVHLQTGQTGMSQDADELLPGFPNITDEMFNYDVVVAFDADWMQLSHSQVQLLERWVAEQAGGLVLIAGPVHLPMWSVLDRQSPRIQAIKALYPVVFHSETSAMFHLGQSGGDQAWPLEFTPEGNGAEFLWLADSFSDSQSAWAGFPGVYGFSAIKSTKPGAKVYATYSDPQVVSTGESPVYLAGHFYGSGRVFYMASGEMWRLRGVDESYFEQFYTKLIRYVSQGRLLRDSNRGLLMVEKDRCLLGETIAVRAALTDSQHQPLTDESVSAVVISPRGDRIALTLNRSATAVRQGMYAANLTVRSEGDYRVELAIPGDGNEELLVREVHARLPDLEVEKPQRNDFVLKQIAQGTGGRYFVGMPAVAPENQRSPLAGRIQPKDQITYFPGSPDHRFDLVLMSWILVFLSFVLCLEWLIRRFHKLA